MWPFPASMGMEYERLHDHDGTAEGRLRLEGDTIVREVICPHCGANLASFEPIPYRPDPRLEDR